MTVLSQEVSDTHRTCKGWPHLPWGCSVLQLSQQQPTWAEKLLTEYLNLWPCFLSPRQAARLSPRLTWLNVPEINYGVWKVESSPALHPSSVPTPRMAGSSQAGRRGIKSGSNVSWGDNGLAVGGILVDPRKNCFQCG